VPPTLSDRLAHIIEAISGIERMLLGKTRSDVMQDRMLRLAVERELEIISEASRRIPEAARQRNAGINWTAMAALGNRLRHAHHRVDVDILLAIVESDLPPLKQFIERMIAEERSA
jgi:uncharacterized protein with HEPN domain